MMLSREEMTARSIRLSGRPADRYTGTPNDPHSEAMSRYTGPAWAQHFGALQKVAEDAELAGKSYRIGYGGFGNTTSDSVGHDSSIGGGSVPRRGQSLGAMRVMDDESARTNALNAYLGEMQDDRRREYEVQRALSLRNDAAATAASDQQEVNRAMAIANTPGVSQFGRPIVGGNGTYRTVAPTGDEPPVNRQAIAAQMAPGKIAPPPPVTFGKPEAMMVAGQDGKPVRSFVRIGSDGLPYDMGRQKVDPSTVTPLPDKNSAEAGNTDVADTVAGMMAGTLPPQLPGRASKDYLAITGEAKRQGYDLARAATDWTATQKHVQTMNGAQQLRLNQAVNALPEMLDSVDTLAQQWKGGKFPLLNKASLALAKGGAYGADAASIANRLDAQIADVVADLGNVYMGGNSPTDHALSLAGKSLNGEWDEKVLRDMVKLAKQNVQIRRNSIANTGVAGASADNPYGNQRTPESAGATVEMIAPDGRILDVPAADVAKMTAAGAKKAGG